MKLRPLPRDGESALAQSLQEQSSRPDFALMTTLRYDADLRHLTRRIPIAMENSDEDVFFLSKLHHQRLRYGAKVLGWEVPISHSKMVASMAAAVAGSETPLRVRVTVDRTGALECQTTPVPPRDNLFSGLSVAPAAAASDSPDPHYDVLVDARRVSPDLFNMIKTTHRDLYDEVRERHGVVTAATPTEVLIVGDDGRVLEGTTTSIAVHRDGDWITPRLTSGGMVGVLRSFLIELGFVKEGDVFASDLKNGDDVLLFNGVQGVCAGTVRL